MSKGKDILVVVEAAKAQPSAACRELIGLARAIAQPPDSRVCAVLFGDASNAFAEALIACGVDQVLVVESALPNDSPIEARLAVLAEVCKRVDPHVVLFTHDLVGAELASRLAFRLDGAVATGCVALHWAADGIHCIRPCYGGLAREEDVFTHAPVMASVRSGVFEPAPLAAGRAGEIIRITREAPFNPRSKLIARTLDPVEGVRLDDARVIVAGGRGLEGPEGFRVLEDLAHELGAAVGASRVPCDLGWCPHSWQIGLTGKTVTPELYIAVGISGAGQHMAGCGNAKTIVVINTDAQAAILQDARFAVVGDYRELVPAITAELRKRKAAAKNP